MSKLDEVIKQLENISFPFENSDWSIIEDCTESLIELSKPVQYTVEISVVPSYIFDYVHYYKAMLNGIKISNDYNLEGVKHKSFEYISSHTKLLGFPPITIEQITFVEV